MATEGTVTFSNIFTFSGDSTYCPVLDKCYYKTTSLNNEVGECINYNSNTFGFDLGDLDTDSMTYLDYNSNEMYFHRTICVECYTIDGRSFVTTGKRTFYIPIDVTALCTAADDDLLFELSASTSSNHQFEYVVDGDRPEATIDNPFTAEL